MVIEQSSMNIKKSGLFKMTPICINNTLEPLSEILTSSTKGILRNFLPSLIQELKKEGKIHSLGVVKKNKLMRAGVKISFESVFTLTPSLTKRRFPIWRRTPYHHRRVSVGVKRIEDDQGGPWATFRESCHSGC